MITAARCRGYRALEDVDVPLRRITIIFGKNNSGKTTLIRLPLFVQASLQQQHFYALASNSVRFGASFRDLGSAGDPHPKLSFGLSNDRDEAADVTLQLMMRDLEESVVVEHARIGRVDASLPDQPPLAEAAAFAEKLGSLIHVTSARDNFAPVYEARPPIGPTAAEIPYWLWASPELEVAVSSWLQSNFDGLPLEIDRSGPSFRLMTGESPASSNFSAAGRGSQSVLTIVTMLQIVRLKLIEADLLIVEEPEAHLHPSAHASLAELLAEVSRATQVLVETHSENILLRLRRRVATGDLTPADIALLFVDDTHEIREIPVDSLGGVGEWPAGVFEYDLEEARAIVEARLVSMGEQ